jgi:hypothetical protein
MKNIILSTFILLLPLKSLESQEWFTNFDIAKRLALVQDKMLFVVWEESLFQRYPLTYNTAEGDMIITDLSQDNSFDELIWEYFVPVLLPESAYEKIRQTSEGRSAEYLAKLNDDSIKIMDVNMNIFNSTDPFNFEQNLSKIIKTYSLRTTLIKQDLTNYLKHKNFTTAFNLASKYLDLAMFVETDAREEIVVLANIYFNESIAFLDKTKTDNREAYLQRIKLLSIKESLLLNAGKKAKRQLKKLVISNINKINIQLYDFLKYTTFMCLGDNDSAALHLSKLSNVNIKKANLIIKMNN